MELCVPNIYLFNTRREKYFYDVNKHKIVKIGKEVYNTLQKMLNGEKIEHEFITQLKKEGFLSSKRLDDLIHPMDSTIEDYLNFKLRKITLQVTQECNFRCSYCTYSDDSANRKHTNKSMTWETAKKAIDFLINHSMDTEVINVGFYGGEPLLEFELIKQCINYTKQVGEGKTITYTITTNGSLINEKILVFLYENDIPLVISLDGPKEINDKHRKFSRGNCGTFETVYNKLNYIKSKYPDYFKKITFSTVIDPESNFNCAEKFFSANEILKNNTITSTFINDQYLKNKNKISKEFYDSWEYEKFILLLAMCQRVRENNISKFFRKMFEELRQTISELHRPTEELKGKGHHGGPCIPGQLRLFVDVDGDLFPCERVLESSKALNIGNIEYGFDVEKAKMLLNIGRLTEKECKNCFAVRECTICAGQAIDISTVEHNLSREVKLKSCDGVRKNIEDRFKRVCVLTELGYKYNDTTITNLELMRKTTSGRNE